MGIQIYANLNTVQIRIGISTTRNCDIQICTKRILDCSKKQNHKNTELREKFKTENP